jgi:hypothetical protein
MLAKACCLLFGMQLRQAEACLSDVLIALVSTLFADAGRFLVSVLQLPLVTLGQLGAWLRSSDVLLNS